MTDQPDHASQQQEAETERAAAAKPAEAAASGQPTEPTQSATRAHLTHQAPPTPVRLRRAPRYRAFVVTGVLVGALIAVVLSGLTANDPQFSSRSVLGYLVVILALIGAVIGAGVAILVERPRRSGR